MAEKRRRTAFTTAEEVFNEYVPGYLDARVPEVEDEDALKDDFTGPLLEEFQRRLGLPPVAKRSRKARRG